MVGAGGVGLNVIQGARLMGATTVIAVDIQESKLEFATMFGATHTVNPHRPRPSGGACAGSPTAWGRTTASRSSAPPRRWTWRSGPPARVATWWSWALLPWANLPAFQRQTWPARRRPSRAATTAAHGPRWTCPRWWTCTAPARSTSMTWWSASTPLTTSTGPTRTWSAARLDGGLITRF